MENKIAYWVIIGMFVLGTSAVIAGELAPQPEEPMGVWITSINDIPTTQTDQIGQFRIFEVKPQGGT